MNLPFRSSPRRALVPSGAAALATLLLAGAVARAQGGGSGGDPGALLNEAVEHAMMDRCEEALSAFDRFFRSCEGCREEEEGRERHAAVREQCTARVKVTTTPDGATVRVDGKVLGEAPLALTLSPGDYELVIELDGRAPHREQIRVEAGTAHRMTVTLPTAPSGPGGRPETAGVPPAPPPRQEAAGRWAVLPWLALGVGAAALAGGGVLGYLAEVAREDEESALARVGQPGSPPLKGEIEGHRADRRTRAVLANVALGVGAASVAAGAVLLLLAGDPPAEEASCGPRWQLDGAGMGCRW